jgi:hypothetical protein
MGWRFQFRFAEADREQYGDQQYELDVTPEGLSRVPIGLLEEFEDETGMRVLGDWLDRLGASELKAIRAFMWLAWRMGSDGKKITFADFRPNVLAVLNSPDLRQVGDGQGNGPSPAANRATRRQSPRKSSGSSTRSPRRASAS